MPLHLQQLADMSSIGKWSRKGQPSGRGGTGTLSVNGKQVAQRSLPRTQPLIWARDEALDFRALTSSVKGISTTFDVGLDTGTLSTTRLPRSPNNLIATAGLLKSPLLMSILVRL